MTFRATGLAALATALALWAAAPGVGLGLLAWVALVPAAAASLADPGGRAGRLAVPLAYALYLELLLVLALPFGIAERQWGDPVLPILVGDSPVLAVALVAVPLVGLALYALRFPTLGLAPRGLFAAVFVPALAWTTLDLLRVKFDPSGLWGPLFLSQSDTAAAPLAAVVGPWALTFAVVAGNYLLAYALVRREVVRPAATAGALVLLVALSALFFPADATGRLTVGVVQPGYDTSEFDRPVLRHFRPENRDYEPGTLDLVGDFEPLTRTAAGRGAALVVWPEATAWVDPHATASVRAALGDLAAEVEASLVVPYFLRSRAESAVLAVTTAGELTTPQPKQRPMWFLGERSPEGPARPVQAGSAPVGLLLGVDNEDPGAARALVARGALLLASSTHDWAELAVQQRAFSRLHAVALGVPVVRADWRYGSAVFDSDGRTAADLGIELARGAAVAEVALRAPTPYVHLGDVVAWACVAAAAALGAAARLRGRASAG